MSSATFQNTSRQRSRGGPPEARPPGLPDGRKAACLGRSGRVCCEAGAVSSICRAACTQRTSHGSTSPGEELLALRPLLKHDLLKDNRPFPFSPTRRGGEAASRKVQLPSLQAV